MSHITRFFQLSLALGCLLIVLSACGQPASSAQARADGAAILAPTTTTQQPTPASTQAAPDSGGQTCPTGGNGRAASMPALTPSKRGELIYMKQQIQADTSTLMRYDIASQTSQTILQIPTTAESSASMSPNGQWILLLSKASGQPAIQIVRADGQDLQTLYCASTGSSIGGAQISSNQHLLAFGQIDQNMVQSEFLVLDLTTGQVRTVLSSHNSGYPQPQGFTSTLPHTPSTRAPLLTYVSPLAANAPLNPLPSQQYLHFQPQQWINNTSLYLSGATQAGSPGPIPQLYLLRDINSGVAQQQGNVQLVTAMTSIQNCNNFDITPDNQSVVCSISTQMGWTGPAQIQMVPMSGGTARTVYNGPNGGVTTTRTISNSTVIFTLSQNGQPDSLWKVNTDGSGLTQLATGAANSSLQFANNGYQPWSILSPDGTLYVIGENNPSNGTGTLLINRFNQGSGGAARGMTISGNGLVPVGWAQYV